MSWKFDAMEELSGATDAANSWARDMGVPETESPAGLKALIYKLWDEAGLRLHRCLDRVQEVGLKVEKLEVEGAQLREELRIIKARLKRELADARRDSARLDWFLVSEARDFGAFCEWHDLPLQTSRTEASLDEWRAAIDAAMPKPPEARNA